MKRLVLLAAAITALAATGVTVAAALSKKPPAPTNYESLYTTLSPAGSLDPESAQVTNGVRFAAAVPGNVSAVEVYRPAGSSERTVNLWSGNGAKLATGTIPTSSATGWVVGRFTTPVHINAGTRYVASVFTRNRYNSQPHGFDQPRTVGHLSVSVGGGVYSYGGIPTFPRNVWENEELFVSPRFVPDVASSSSPAPSPSSSATSSPTPPTTSPAPTTTSPAPKSSSAPTSSPAPSTTSPAPTKTTPPSTTATTPTPSPRASTGGPYTCVQTANRGRCSYSAVPYITGANSDPWVDQNDWGDNPNYKQTLYAASPRDWYIIGNGNFGNGGVLTYPNTGFWMTGKVDANTSVTSTFSTSFPHNPQTIGWAAYDLWFNNWADEVMIQTDISANQWYDCTPVATATFGGDPWHLCVFGSERVWKHGTDDSHLINQASGSLDIKAMIVWLEQHGYLPAASTWTAASYGFEVCNTSGLDAKFWVNDFSWSAN